VLIFFFKFFNINLNSSQANTKYSRSKNILKNSDKKINFFELRNSKLIKLNNEGYSCFEIFFVSGVEKGVINI